MILTMLLECDKTDKKKISWECWTGLMVQGLASVYWGYKDEVCSMGSWVRLASLNKLCKRLLSLKVSYRFMRFIYSNLCWCKTPLFLAADIFCLDERRLWILLDLEKCSNSSFESCSLKVKSPDEGCLLAGRWGALHSGVMQRNASWVQAALEGTSWTLRVRKRK